MRCRPLLVLLVLGILPTHAAAALRYWCPYERHEPQTDPQIEVLHLSVNRIEPMLRTEQGTSSPLTPWEELEDRQSGPPGRPQRAMVALPDSISQAAQDAMRDPIQQGGAGCALVPQDEPGPPGPPPRPQLFALGAFPDPGTVLQNFNTVEATLPAPWSILEGENAYGSDGTTTTCTAGGCHMAYTPSPSGAADADAFVTFISAGGNMDIGLRGSDGATANTLNGYVVRKPSGVNALRIYRVVDNVFTLQGAECTLSFTPGANDSFGIRVEGDQIRGYAKDGAAAWAVECGPRTETSITGGGFGFLRQSSTGTKYENFGFTRAAATVPRASLGVQLLRGQ